MTNPVLTVESRYRLHDLNGTRIVGREGLCAGWRFGVGNEQVRSVVDSTDDDCVDHAFQNFFGGSLEADRWHVVLAVYDLSDLSVTQYIDGVEVLKQPIDEVRTKIDFPAQLAIGDSPDNSLNADLDFIHFTRHVPTVREVQLRARSASGALGEFGPIERL